MKVNFKFICSLLLSISIFSCTPKENKNAEGGSASSTSTAIKDFERPVPPAVMISMQDREEYMITHYWDKFNFSDTMYCHAPHITDNAFMHFISKFPYATKDKIHEGVKKMLDYALVDVVMYNYFYKLGERFLYDDPNSTMRNDEYFIPFLEHVVSTPKIVEENKIRHKYLLNLAYKNRPGEKASNFTYTLNSEQTGTLYGISSKYVLLMFFNPDCRECQHTTAQLKEDTTISAAISSGTLKILAVYPDEDPELWRKYLAQIPSTWINGYDKTLAVKSEALYDLRAIPTLYLLDKDKTVIFKDVTEIEIIRNYLVQNP